VLDDGRLTDGQGRTVDFRNTLIIMTSNIGAEYMMVTHNQEASAGEVREYVLAEVRSRFRPEFLNRLDDIILFERLKREEMTSIVDIQLMRLERLLSERKITLHVDEAAKQWLADHGYDPAYGARPLKRVIQRYVQDPLAEMMLAGSVLDGQSVNVSQKGENLVINDKEVQVRAA
ncbi:MAG: AAA family ATPase, partial [Pseudomonadota bacterium]